ncbi:hypothetical protein L2Y94_07590 [Luteibacter aegosomatis]|uniref:hypothetical protein n=1 Tax=Luteibacter aegosomatis TaxID=2911537 RepID=UPI001FF9C08D|nr:hypothetical protein [Luteibacter aegosomatis]UPG87206.1 hypothetical protein L2Y94_07590 [Luteibacter aegosomatis]
MKRLLPFFALALAGTSAIAGDVSMAGGDVRFHVPDAWVSIMQSDGDTESQVFQVPGSSAADATLARVSITLQKAPSLLVFQQFDKDYRDRASHLTEYKPGKAKMPTEHVYSAKEGTVRLEYYERYFYANGYAIQLRCIRPSGDAKFSATFDKGCADVAASMPS